MDLSHVHFRGKPAIPRRVAGPAVVQPAAPPGQEPSVAASLADSPIDNGLLRLILAHAGLDPAAYRSRPLERRLGACLRALRVHSEHDARAQLESHPELHDVALSALLIGVSGFFRDAAVFHALRTLVMPALRERRRPLRIWSVGCSTGAELYSIAILLAEARLLEGSLLLGTDCRADAVERAREGVFSDEALADMDEAGKSRYFERARAGWRVVESLRCRTVWQVADATVNACDGPWDLVLCRNLAIYLQVPVGDAMFRGIARRLSPGGFLVVGKAERPAASSPLVAIGRCVYQNNEA